MSTSPWIHTAPLERYPTLNKDLSVDVCVVGGGIAGITTAYLLQKEGKRVCVLEAYGVGSGQTGQTTAHITTVLDKRYFELEDLHGTQGIEYAAEAHDRAQALIYEIARSENIECDLEEVKGYLFLGPNDHPETLSKELTAVNQTRLPEVYQVRSIPGLPFETGPALCFPRQYQFHPLKFLAGVANAFTRNGGQIFERTRVIEVLGGKKANVTTENGFEISCKSIVVATHAPINDLFAIHTKQAPYRTYAISARIPKDSVAKGLYWDTAEPYHYIRVHTDPTHPTHDLLIVGGEDHKTGQNKDPEESYTRLEKWMRERFTVAAEITHKWSGQILEPIDGLSFLGHNPMDKNNVYIITGDSGNGMTHSMIGATLITDQIFGRKNKWETLFEPSRKNIRAFKKYFQENANVAAQYKDWFAEGEIEDLDEVERGEGAIYRDGTHLIAAYRDPTGKLSTVSASCPHLGGVVHWNSAEKTWDCPCHGSRFDAQGRVIEGPACADLKPYWVETSDRIPIVATKATPDINLAP